MRQKISLNEAQLHRIIKESVIRILNEEDSIDEINDKNYGEDWYNPFTWKSKKTKANMDAKRRQQAQRLQQINADIKRDEDREFYRQQWQDYEDGMARARAKQSKPWPTMNEPFKDEPNDFHTFNPSRW